MSNQTNIQEEIRKAEHQLGLLKDIEVLDAEFRLIKNEYLQRRSELCERLNGAEKLIPENCGA